MNRQQATAAALTLAVALLTVLMLQCTSVRVDTSVREWPPRHDGEVTLAEADEQFFDVVSEPAPAALNDPAEAYNPEPADHATEPAPASGHSVKDAGEAGDAPAVATSKQPSPVKTPKDTPPAKTGPSKEDLERQAQEEARRKASAATRDAFRRAEGSGNTSNSGQGAGNSGSPSGGNSAVNGSGSGTAGGGWVIPHYAAVPSSLTGSIKMTLKIDRSGAVTSVAFTGGQPPAATDAALRRAVEREVRSRRFTRAAGTAAPESATAYITYTFR